MTVPFRGYCLESRLAGGVRRTRAEAIIGAASLRRGWGGDVVPGFVIVFSKPEPVHGVVRAIRRDRQRSLPDSA